MKGKSRFQELPDPDKSLSSKSRQHTQPKKNSTLPGSGIEIKEKEKEPPFEISSKPLGKKEKELIKKRELKKRKMELEKQDKERKERN